MHNRLNYYLLRYKWRYLVGFVCLIGASLVVMLPPVFLRKAIDAIDAGTSTSQLVKYAVVIMVLAVVESAMRFGSRLYISGTSREVEYDLRNDMAQQLMALDQSFYTASQTGDLMARCTNDTQRVRELMGPAVLEICRAVTMMLIGFAFMLSINPKLALISLGYFPAIALLMVRFRETVETKYRDVQDQFGELSNRVQESISGIRAVKAYAQEDSETQAFVAANRELMGRTMSWAIYMGAFWPLMVFSAGASTALVLWFGGHDVVNGWLTIGEFVQFNAYLAILANPLMGLGWTVTMAQQGIASMKRVAEVLNLAPRIADPSNPVRLDRPRGDVEFRNVTFGYYDEPVLSQLNLKVPAGRTVALVGGTGSGKTTLVSLLVRLYDPWQGQVLFDGVDVRELSLEQLRDLVGYVPQETFLFSESLRENIALGNESASAADLDFAVETSQLVNDLPQLTHGIETGLGERGVTLSGGQKQRTALARALIKAPPVVVLDDALSHVDTHTEEEILRRLRGFMQERTTILIAHRTSTLASADLIVALEGGRIVEQGTHAELVALDGVYARFYRKQLLVEQIESGQPNGGARVSSYFDDEEYFGKVYDGRILKRLGGYLRPYLALLSIAGFVVLCIAGLQVAGPLIVREAIDHQIKQGRSDDLPLLVGAYIGVLLTILLLSFVQAVLMTYIGQRVMLDMRLQLFSHLQRMSIAFFDRNPVGRLLTRVTNDISTLEMVLSQGVIETLTNVVSLAAIAVVLLLLDWQLALIMLGLLPFLVLFVRAVAMAQRAAFRDQRSWLSRLNAYLNENITGMSVVQLFNRQRRNFQRFDDRNKGLLAANLRVTFFYAVFEPAVVFFNAITIAIILWYGGGRVLDDALTLGTMVAFLQYMQRFFWPIRELAERYTTIQQAMAGCERIFGVLDEAEEVSDVESPVELDQIRGEIEFRNVWFAYDEDNWVLRDVSFVIRPGEKVAIVGATGAGKSTMMSLLNRFYDVQRGAILVDGVSIMQLRQRQLRRQVGLVLQDPFIFTDTVEANIRMRDDSISAEQVHAAARLVGADAFILRLRDGYESLLAERGANLSTGQKQLIALARVAAFDPQIVLVMDEATASIDPETEDTLQRSMRQVMQGRTSIVIAHRLNTIRNVDRILVLNLGRVVEEGTHEQLLAAQGTYFRLYELQYKDQDIGVR